MNYHYHRLLLHLKNHKWRIYPRLMLYRFWFPTRTRNGDKFHNCATVGSLEGRKVSRVEGGIELIS